MTLHASPGEWTGDPSFFSYQWYRRETVAHVYYVRPWWLLGLVKVRRTIYRVEDLPIAGATAPSYTPTAADDGRIIYYTVTAHNRHGSQRVDGGR